MDLHQIATDLVIAMEEGQPDAQERAVAFATQSQEHQEALIEAMQLGIQLEITRRDF